ncbi:uncharacterized protein BDZ99DRAFT_566081 [Mytilinidion resinicola]|uniref:Myb-like DNA-binding domain-containing protein n=1 Tax=Mytilinidion resinicola TaxID=574789 RepID=A0A6A6Z523_9PEZI|nr:uncharacterized protein BDZ99DRAFT_566081 [Mytilinidion resinicola]KAF2816232.1 hypothetical protein BDZ99DRAFT_566081 [Mytilinidion resinicola]
MPSEDENIKFLYLILTINGPPNALINWDAVGSALNLKKGAVTKRWSRLQKAIKDGTNPGPSAHELLWLLVKHTSGEAGKSFDWKVIAEACYTTPGAASKRFSRLKQAQAAGTLFTKDSENSNESAATKGEAAGKTAGISKRKRDDSVTPTDAADAMPSPGQDHVENEHNEDDEASPKSPKKRKAPVAKAKSPAKPKANGGAVKALRARKTTRVQKEVVEEDDGQHHQDNGQRQDVVIKQEHHESPAPEHEHEAAEGLEHTFMPLSYYQNPVPQNDLSAGWRVSNQSNEYNVYSTYDRLPGYGVPADVARNIFGDVV